MIVGSFMAAITGVWFSALKLPQLRQINLIPRASRPSSRPVFLLVRSIYLYMYTFHETLIVFPSLFDFSFHRNASGILVRPFYFA